MPANTRGRPRQDVTTKPTRVQRSAARRSRLLTNICVESESESDVDMEVDLETLSTSNLRLSSLNTGQLDPDVHLLGSNSVSNNDVVFIKERRIPRIPMDGNTLIPQKLIISGLSGSAPGELSSSVPQMTTVTHTSQNPSSSGNTVLSTALSPNTTRAVGLGSVLNSLTLLSPSTPVGFPSAAGNLGHDTSGGRLFRNLPVEVCISPKISALFLLRAFTYSHDLDSPGHRSFSSHRP